MVQYCIILDLTVIRFMFAGGAHRGGATTERSSTSSSELDMVVQVRNKLWFKKKAILRMIIRIGYTMD